MAGPLKAKNDSAAVLHPPLLLGSFSFIFLMFGLPIAGKIMGASALAIGGLYSVFTVTVMVLRPVVGWAVDRFGRKRFLVGALMGYAIAMGLFAFAKSIEALYLARLVQGIASSFMWISVNTITADLSSPRIRGREMGRVQEMVMRGGLYGVLAGYVLVMALPKRTAWQIAFIGYAILAAAGAWLAWKSVPETRFASPAPATWRRSVSRQLLALMVIVFTTGLSMALIDPIYLIFLQDKFTTDITTLGWAFFPAGVVHSVLPSRSGGLSDRFGRAPLMAIGLVSAGLLSLVLPSLPSLIWLIVLYTLAAIGWAMAAPAEAAMVADLIGSDARGAGYGLYEFARSFGATVGPLLGGWLYDAAGKAVPFHLNGIILLASAVWVLLLLRQPSLRELAG